MSEPTDKARQQDDGVDIFNMGSGTQGAAPTAGATSESSAARNGTAESNSTTQVLRPLHFAIGGAVLAAAWIAWPYMFSAVPAGDPRNAAPHMLRPDQLPAGARSDIAATQQPKISAPSPARLVEPDEAAATPAPVVANASLKGPAPVDSTALQAKVDDLQNKLAQAEAQGQACQRPAAPVAPRAKSQGVHRSGHRTDRSREKEVATVPGPVVPDFSLNTIYRGQAWIQTSERTYVVQAGDVVDGLRIERVDPRGRQVVTSRGVIR